MGEVYRATDTNLKRAVAIKVLPESVAGDAERLARFQREAEVLAALNHPNIAAIYGLERSGAMTALVLELVEGPTLADRIAQGAIPVDEALPVARQIAEALEAAHEQGIIHRDLKPANIKVRPDGTVKVLDFGLAKAMESVGGGQQTAGSLPLSQSPTITTPAMMTAVGMVLGTAAYMSPEQARGRTVDKRADIWAFGAVLFEMLTGARPFEGEDIAETLGAVLHKEPVWPRLPEATPASIRTVLRRCLQKDPRQRLRDIGDVRLALDGAFETAAPESTASATGAASRGRLVWIVAGVAVLAAAALAIPAVRHLRETPPLVPPETRTEIVTPATDNSTDFALSPDGRQIVFVAPGDGRSRLWMRSLATTTAHPLAGTEGATAPFWSPDNRSIGFFNGGALKRLDIVAGGGGAPQTLAAATSVTNGSGTWSADGVILFASSLTSPIMRVSAAGGAALAVTMLGPQQQGHILPHFLPDGRRFLFSVWGPADIGGIYLGALDGSAPARLAPEVGAGLYLPEGTGLAGALREGGWLLWVREGTLVAQRLDVAKPALTGEPVTVAEWVIVDDYSFRSSVSVAATGLVAYRSGEGAKRQLAWFDRSGTAQGTIGDADATLSHPALSPDGRRVAVSRVVQGNYDIWLLDGARTSRLTFDGARDDGPVWSADGARIVFRSNRKGHFDLYQKLTRGAGVEEPLVVSDQLKFATSASADGRFLLYVTIDPQTNYDLWVQPMADPSSPGGSAGTRSVLLKTPFRETRGDFSPDGRWVAYHSNESGRNEIYVRPLIAPGVEGTVAGLAGGQWQVSTAGGIMPLWRSDGKELFYLNAAGEMMASPITATGSTLEPGTPVVLFPTRIVGGGVDVEFGRQYDVAPDGRFLINMELATAAPITLLQNWNPEVKQ
jgi:Tol biopolymer transport system component